MTGPIEKTCTKCKATKPLTDFHLQPRGPHGRHSWCKPCANAGQRAAKKRNYTPENKRRWQIKTRYGLSMAEVDAMKVAQDGQCAICKRSLTRFHIDHDHFTGKVRGLLCHGCNIGIGRWDDTVWFSAALRYMGVSVK